MQQPDLPKLNRDIPKPMAWFFMVMLYGVFGPINWLMTRFGGSLGLMLRRGKKWEKMTARITASLSDYTPTEHDVFVNTFSKSGTNWMMQVTYQTAFLGEGEFDNIYDVVPWPEIHVQMNGKFTVPLDDTRVQRASPTQLRVIKSHLAVQYMPYNDKARYITVIRDPKDAFVSSYHFIKGIYGPLMPSVAHWLDSFLTADFPLGFGASWAQHTAGYWALRNKPNVLVLSFRDMKRNLPDTVDRVADLLGVALTPAQREAVIQKSTFDYMKSIDGRFFPVRAESLPWTNISMVRAGKDGASGELLTPEQQRRIDVHCLQELKALDSDFPYEEFCRVSY